MSLPDRATFKVCFESGVNTSRTMRVGNGRVALPLMGLRSDDVHLREAFPPSG